MNCPYCGSRLGKRDRCDRCGEDMTLFKRVFRISNSYYNEGLRKARVRDLSGAIISLKNSLKCNKRNTDARNLLGLIYLEMGETVKALSEWVISKHFQGENNRADEYIRMIQQNPAKLETQSQLIKRYNNALLSARQGSDDLAIIQLKKVVSMNPHYVQALLLLGLIYLQNRDFDRAKKCLLRASKVDATNTTTLAYLEELRELQEGDGAPTENSSAIDMHTSSDSIRERDVITPIAAYSEEKPNILAWVNLVLGVIIGAAFIMIAIVPGIRKDAIRNSTADVIVLNERLVKVDAELDEAKKENDSLRQDIRELEYQLKAEQEKPLEIPEVDLSAYEHLFAASVLYEAGDEAAAAEELIAINKEELEIGSSSEWYGKMSGKLFEEQAKECYNKGYNLYSDGKYEEAIEELDKALTMNPDHVDAMYFTARSYHRLDDIDTAKIWYNKIIDGYPDSGRAGEAKGKLREIE